MREELYIMAETIALSIFFFFVLLLIIVIVILAVYSKRQRIERENERNERAENVAEEDNDQSQNPQG